MKKRITTLIIFSLTLISINAQCQFVTIEGRQFKIGTSDFYPMVCTYTFCLVYNTGSPGTIYLSRSNSYGPGYSSPGNPLPNYDFECSDAATAYNEILADFQKIHEMGFNTIRTHGQLINKIDPGYTNVTGFTCPVFENKHPIWGGTFLEIEYLPPYDSNYDLQNILLPALDLVLQAAEACSLKVIFDVGFEEIAGTDYNAQDYASFLGVFSYHFRNNTTLLGYVTVEEPEFSGEYNLSKYKVCEYTSMWYKAIKTSDPNHFVTIGGCGDWGWNWDPAAVWADFYSVHIYPYVKQYEGYNPVLAFSRAASRMIWTYRNSPMPWIIGETGFSAIDDQPGSFAPPDVDGDLDDQQDFAENSLDIVRNCGGSGYSWWNFQENWWGSPIQDGYGLLRHGALNWPTIDKPVVDAFESYPYPPPTPQACDEPANYRDMDNYHYYSPSATPLTGTITDINSGNPIEEAMFRADVIAAFDPSLPKFQSPLTFYTYTYTDANGHFELTIDYPGSTSINVIAISTIAAGSNSIWIDIGLWNYSILYDPIDLDLYYRPFKYDQFIDNEVVQSGDSRTIRGWQSLTLSNVIVENGANCEMKARNQVLVNGSFTAALGSSVLLYCTETFPECGDFDYSLIFKSTIAEESGNEPCREVPKNIELEFIPVKDYIYFDVFPNPGDGIYNLVIRSSDCPEGITHVNVYSVSGALVYQHKFSGASSTIDLTNLKKGLYYLEAITPKSTFNEKLIIQ